MADLNQLEQITPPQMENRYNATSTSQQYPAPQHGGRVPNINSASAMSFSSRPHGMYASGNPVFSDDARTDLIGHQHGKTPLNTVFFSQSNIAHVHAGIQNQVSLMSDGKYKIDKQGDDEVRIVMRSYYLMFARNDPHQVAQELDELNRRVIAYCATKVYSEVDFHMFYMKDLEDFASPIANPINTGVVGTRVGELKSFF
jgi:hypothetical protein